MKGTELEAKWKELIKEWQKSGETLASFARHKASRYLFVLRPMG